MNVVEYSRHSYKEGDGLSYEGRQAAIARGNARKEQYQGYEMNGISSPVGRAVETLDLILHGAGVNDKARKSIDSRLGYTITNDDIEKIRKSDYSSMAEKAIYADKGARARVINDAFNAARVIEENAKGQGKEYKFLVGHGPTVEVLGYLLSRGKVRGESEPLGSITVTYDSSLGVYRIVMNYANGEEIIVTKSLVEECESTLQEILAQEKGAHLSIVEPSGEAQANEGLEGILQMPSPESSDESGEASAEAA